MTQTCPASRNAIMTLKFFEMLKERCPKTGHEEKQLKKQLERAFVGLMLAITLRLLATWRVTDHSITSLEAAKQASQSLLCLSIQQEFMAQYLSCPTTPQ